MRKFILIACFVTVSNSVSAQWTTSGSNIVNSNTGNVGIGTASPGAKVHVSGGSILLEDDYAIRSNGSIGAHLISRNSAGMIALGSGEPSDWLVLNSGGQEKVRITSEGRVGIGTTTPLSSYKLDVRGNILTNGFIGHLHSNGVFNYGLIRGNENGTTIIGDSQSVHVLSSGNVGIGTADPQGYKLAVAGNIITESIKVKLHSQWPDFVFDKDYSLTPLSEVEKYIKANAHLPDMPSSKEVYDQGLDLGVINVILVQKIEELTLHLIDQNKKYSLLLERLEKLEAERE